MTHRDKIRSTNRLTSLVRSLLQQFYSVDLATAPILVQPRPKGDTSSARTNGSGVFVWENVWISFPAPNLLVVLTHELTHWEQILKRGIVRVYLYYAWVTIKSLLFSHEWYDSELSSDERQAEERQRLVKSTLSDSQTAVLDQSV